MVEIYPKFNNGPVEATFQWFFERGYHCFYNKLASGLVEVKSVDEMWQRHTRWLSSTTATSYLSQLNIKMPLQLSKSVFVHIPKCGGRWATQALLQNCHALIISVILFTMRT